MATTTADIVCRTCGVLQGVFLVLRSESGTTYECQTCADQSCPVHEALDSWMYAPFPESIIPPLNPPATPA